MLALIATLLSFFNMATWLVDESYNDLDLKRRESNIFLYSDETSRPKYSPSCCEDLFMKITPPCVLQTASKSIMQTSNYC